MPYRPSSMVLFLTNCSFTKTIGGAAGYDESRAITSVLPTTLGDRLLGRRASIFGYMKDATDFYLKGASVSELEINRDLSQGPDLRGRRVASYLPALDRYEGRFFLALGPGGKQKLMESEHHTLFLSGLYGLVPPTEPIQRYSCPLDPEVAQRWREDALLTDVLCEYVRRFGIARIIDMTAIDAYRELIDWEKVSAIGTDVLHCFDENAAGDDALIPFGKCLAGKLLDLTEDEIVELSSDHRFESVILRSLKKTAPGLPSEEAGVEPPRPSSERRPASGNVRADLPWRFECTARFRRDVRKHMNQFTRISQATLNVCHDPMTPGVERDVKPLKGRPGVWRCRLGDDRIVYRPDEGERRVVFERFGPRGGVYN